MANDTLQQQLGETTAPRDQRQLVPSADLSSIGTAFSRIFNDVRAKKDEENLSAVSQKLTALRNTRDEAILFQQDVQARSQNINRAWSDGEISDQEKASWDKYQKDFERLTELNTKGILNDTVFNIQARKLQSEALVTNPRLTKDINNLFSFADDSAKDSENAVQENAIRALQQRYGPSFSARDYAVAQSEAVVASDYDNRLNLGNIDASNITTFVNEGITLKTRDILFEMKNTAEANGGMLNVEQQEVFNSRLLEMKNEVLSVFTDKLTASRARGHVITSAQERAQRQDIEDQFTDLSTVVADKDVYKVLDLLVKTEDKIFESGQAPEFRGLIKMMQLSGTTGFGELFSILGDERLQESLVALGLPLEHFKNGSAAGAYQLLASEMFNIFKNVPTKTPEESVVRSLVTGSSIKNGTNTPETTSAYINEQFKTVGYEPENISSAIKLYNDPVFANNLVANLTPESKKALETQFDQWSKVMVADTLKAVAQSEELTLVTDDDTGMFVVVPRDVKERARFERYDAFTKSRIRQQGGMSLDLFSPNFNNVIRDINRVIELSTNPNYSGIAPDVTEITDTINEMLTTSDKVEVSE